MFNVGKKRVETFASLKRHDSSIDWSSAGYINRL